MTKVDGVLFDKDGTLFDFEATWGAWALALLQSESQGAGGLMGEMAEALGYDLAGRRFRTDSLVIAGTAQEIVQALQTVLPQDRHQGLLDRVNALAVAAPQVEAAPLVPLLLDLSARGLALGVATNDSEAPARAHLRSSGIEHSFDFIAGYDSGYGGKPQPGQLLAFAHQMDLDPARCAMVGDSLHDLHAARAAGFVSVGVLTGMASARDLGPAADVILASVAEIPDWLDG